MSNIFVNVNQQVIDHINTINSYKSIISNIIRKMRVTSESFETNQYQLLKKEIKDKLNELSNKNQELLILMDFKISQITQIIERLKEYHLNNQITSTKKYQHKIQHLEQQIHKAINRQNTLNIQLLQLKNKNIKMVQEFSQLSNNSNRKIEQLLHEKTKHQLSINYESRSPSIKHFMPSIKSSKKIINQTQIIQEKENDHQPSYGQSNKMVFGCIPVNDTRSRTNTWNHLNSKSNKLNNSKQHYQPSDKEHRFDILINNLKESHESSMMSHSNRVSDQHERSVLSNAVVKRYRI